MCYYRKRALLRTVLLALALHELSAYFGVAIRNTGRGRKLQNRYSNHLLSPIDNDKLFIITSLLLISIASVSLGNEVCKRYASHFARRSRSCLANESQAYNQRTRNRRLYLQRRLLVKVDVLRASTGAESDRHRIAILPSCLLCDNESRP
jgi:hypothetical protein